MPINKNAITRYKILDDLLSSRYHHYSLDDLTEEVNNRLADVYPDGDKVVRRTIEKDIHFLENDPFFADIERYSVFCLNPETQRTGKKRCLRYSDPSFSIFKQELSTDERYLLREVFSLLGQFDGLPKLEGLEKLRLSLSLKRHESVISFTKNPLENRNFFGFLFTAINQKLVIELHYQKFGESNCDKIYHLYPYMLREYNGRWYLYGGRVEDDKIRCFPLDRILKADLLPSVKYKKYKGNLNEIFKDIIGVTNNFDDSTIHNILFWVSDKSKDYVLTKPLHQSQRTLDKAALDALYGQYPLLQGGQFFRMNCKYNYELIRELCSFNDQLIVLEPANIQEDIIKQISNMNDIYTKLRTKRS